LVFGQVEPDEFLIVVDPSFRNPGLASVPRDVEVVQGDLGHRPSAPPDAAGFRPQDTKAVRRQSLRDLVVVVGVARERRKQHDGRSAAIDHHVDLNIVVVNEFAAALRGCSDGDAAEREARRQKQRSYRGHRHGCPSPDRQH